MSSELHAFLPRAIIPGRASWQAAIDRLGLPLTLDPTDPVVSSGFCPMTLQGRRAGVEGYVDAVSELSGIYPEIAAKVAGRLGAISFRWGGDLDECACAFGAAAALIEGFGAILFSPDEAAWFERAEDAARIMRDCMGP